MNSDMHPEAQPDTTPETSLEAQSEAPGETASLPEPAAAPTKAARTRAAAPASPSAGQLLTSRGAHWHQAENPLLSIEQMREWLQRSGLVLFTPKPQLGAPAPSLVEASHGRQIGAPELAELDQARSLLTRLIAEGSAVPLNLLGVTGGVGTDQPDFVVSAPVFSYIFTLRGNKAWKQSPVTSGPVKVSPLALAAYEILAAKVTLSAYDLTTQLGKEVTEAAVLRALTELWSQLRVLPVPQQDGAATLWELASSRFTRQIKAGANAGQPSALSALISLYLGQALVATEDEVESYLSPLAPRSRVRDVLHALLAARQLETLVINGKTLLHIAGDLPAFAAANEPEAATTAEPADGSRISKFAARPGSKIGTGLRSKPAFGAKPAFGKKPYGAKPAFGRSEGERRPFDRNARPDRADRPARPARHAFNKPANKPSYDKPWQENRPAAPTPEASSDATHTPSEFTPAPRTYTPRPDSPGTYSPRPARPGFAKRPSFGERGNSQGDSRPPRREFTPRDNPRSSDGTRKTFSKPGTFGRKREGGFAGSDARPPRRDFGAAPARPSSYDRADRPARPSSYDRTDRPERSDRPAPGGFKRPGSYSPRPTGGSTGFSGPRKEFGGKPAYGTRPTSSNPTGSGPRDSGSDAPRKVFRKFDAPRSSKPFGSKPSFGSKPAFGGKPSFGSKPSFGAKPAFGDRGPRPPFNPDRAPRDFDRPRPEGRPSFGSKPGNGGAARKPFGKPSGKPSSSFAAGGGPFAKFADGKKPFRKPGTPRGTQAPRGGDGPRKSPGGFAPTRRKRPESE